MTDPLYIPPYSRSLESVVSSQMRLGIQGFPGTGKTYAAVQFPNPVVLNLDRGLGVHDGKSNIIELPFYDLTFVKTIYPSTPPNVRDAVLLWLNKYGSQLTSSQTLIIDTLTEMEKAYHAQVKAHPFISKQGKADGFEEWTQKITYFDEIWTECKRFDCNVVLLAHETEKDMSKIRPLLTGQAGDKIVGNFTDWFRAITIAKPPTEKIDAFKKAYNLSDNDYRLWMNSTPVDCQVLYLWQTQSDDKFDAKVSSLVGLPKYVLASPAIFSDARYKKKISSATTTV